jgi:hypothetical protein
MVALAGVALAAVAGCASANPPGTASRTTEATSVTGSPRPAGTGSAGTRRPVGEKVPAGVKAVTITEYLGLNPERKPPKPVTITAPAKVHQLVALVNGLPVFPPGTYSCPADFGDGLKLEFRAAPGKTPLAVAVDLLSGCPSVVLTIGGKQQSALAGLSAETVLQIAGLPWTVPSGPGRS